MIVTNKVRGDIPIDGFTFPARQTVYDVPEKLRNNRRLRELLDRGTLVIEAEYAPATEEMDAELTEAIGSSGFEIDEDGNVEVHEEEEKPNRKRWSKK